MANQFLSLPFIPYRIILALLENDNLCKILYYNSFDALSKPNLTFEQKVGMIWSKDINRMDEYHIFMTNTNANAMTEAKTMLQIYRYNDTPINPTICTTAYRFDFLYGTTTAMVEYQNISCNRGDVFQMELMKSLNDKDVAGIGNLQYNTRLSRLCGADVGIGNNSTFTGISIVLATQLSSGDTIGQC